MGLHILPQRGLMALLPALVAEFIGTLLFQLIGGISDPSFAYSGTLINGLALMVLVYATAGVSGGHLNPAISLMAFTLGKLDLVSMFAYNAVQYVGAIVGSSIALGLVPGAAGGAGTGPGCFEPVEAVTNAQVFGWELIMTGVLGFVVAATAMSRRPAGTQAPAAIGITLFVSASVIGQFTGSYINPARVVGPVAVFGCSTWHGKSTYLAGLYIASEYLGGILGGALYMITHRFSDAVEDRQAVAFKSAGAGAESQV